MLRGEELDNADEEAGEMSLERQAFWSEFLSDLTLDDPEQMVPDPFKLGYITFTLPAPGAEIWLTIYRFVRKHEVGVTLSGRRTGASDLILRSILNDLPAIREELGDSVSTFDQNGRELINDKLIVGNLNDTADRERAFAWLRQRTNDFVNVFRPRVREAAERLDG